MDEDRDEQEEGREMSESITKELRDCIFYCPHLKGVADRIDGRVARELQSKQAEVDGLRSDNADLQARLDASMPLPVDADGVPCRIGDLLETEEHIPRKAVGYYLADESTPCVTLDFVSPSIEASLLHHVAPEPPETIEDVRNIAQSAECLTNLFFHADGEGISAAELVDRAYACGRLDGAGDGR